MRLVMLAVTACALAGCGRAEEKRERADAKAAASGFTPPSVMTRVDWGTRTERRFHELDRDQSEKLERNEWPRLEGGVAGRDRDGDGVITEDEFSDAAMARFDRMDLNRDGTVTAEERKTSRDGAATAAR